MSAFDSHHLALKFNLKFGKVILVTKKYSVLSHIVRYAVCFEELIENLFPEIILTRLLDTRIHRLLHFVLNRPELHENLGVEFPFEERRLDDGQIVWEYTGSVPTIFDDMEEQTIEFPSALDVLKVRDSHDTILVF